MDKRPLDSISLSLEMRVDAICNQFEAEFRTGNRPKIEVFLASLPEETRPPYLTELLRVELDLRREINETIQVEEYLSRFPGQDHLVREVFAAAISRVHQPAQRPVAKIHTPPEVGGTVSQTDASIQTSQTGRRTSPPIAAGAATPVPKSFGRYQIEKELGKGAMGVVYLAVDTQLGRKVALKIPKRSSLEDPAALERFYREAQTTSQIRHPNICPVFDVGAIDGTHYLTMAFIPGKPISAFVGKGKLPAAKQVALLIRKIALAIEEAHKNGIIHRDLKPSNVMLDDRNEPIVMDFGLARQTNTAENARLTQSGAILGTPAYMPPEQVNGDLDQIGAQSDIYALGVILYQFLTGELPFNGPILKVLAQIIIAQPKRPSELRPDVDPALEAICLKMMAKDRSQRYGNMKDVAAALTDYLKSVPVGGLEARRQPAGEFPFIFTDPIADQPFSRRRAKTTASRKTLSQRLVNFSLAIVGRLTSNRRLAIVGPALLGLMILCGVIIIIQQRNGSTTVIEIGAVQPAEGTSKMGSVDRPQKAQSASSQADAMKRSNDELGTSSPENVQQELNELRYGITIQDAYRTIEERELPKAQSLLEQCTPRPGQKDCRGWEWYFLNAINRKPHIALTPGHAGRYHVDWNPDGNSIVTSGTYVPAIVYYQPIQQWSIDDGRLLSTISSNGAFAAWQPQGRHLAYVSSKKELCITETSDGRQSTILHVLRFMPKQLIWSEDGRYLAVIAGDSKWQNNQQTITGSELIIWDSTTRKITQQPTFKDKDLYSAAWSPDAARIAIAMIGDVSGKNGTFLFDRRTGKETEFSLNPGLWGRLGWSPDGRFILKNAMNATGQNITVEETESARGVTTISPGGIFDISRTADGVLAADYDGLLRLSSVAPNNRRSIAYTDQSHDSVAWSHDGKRIAISASDLRNGKTELPTIDVWNVADLPAIHQEFYIDVDHPSLKSNHKPVNQWCCWSSDNQHIISADDDGFVAVMTLDDNAGERTFVSANIGSLNWVGCNHDGRIAAAISKTGDIAVCRNLGSQPFERLSLANRRVTAATWCPYKDVLALGMESGDIELWNATDARRLERWAVLSAPIKKIVWSSEGDWIVACDTNAKACEFQIPETNGLPTIESIDWAVSDLAVSADGKKLAVVDKDGRIDILATANRAAIKSLKPVSGSVQSLAWSPDGNRIAVCHSDGYVRVCNPQTDQELLRLPKAEARRRGTPHRQACWSPDGRRLMASGNNDVYARHETIHVWTADFRTLGTPNKIGDRQAMTVVNTDRFAAEWALRLPVPSSATAAYAPVGIRHPPGKLNVIQVHPQDKLPDGPFEVTDLDLSIAKGITEEDVRRFLSPLSHLRRLRLQGSALSAAVIRIISKRETLEILELFNAGDFVNDNTAAQLAELTNLTLLLVSGSRLGDQGLSHIARLKRLQSLWIGDTPVTANGIAKLSILPELKFLDLRGCKIGNEVGVALQNLPALEQLLLGNTNATDDGMVEINKLTRLLFLDLSDTAVSDQGVRRLAGLKRLRELSLHRTRVTPKAVADFEKAHPECKVTFSNERILESGAVPSPATDRAVLPHTTLSQSELAQWAKSMDGWVQVASRGKLNVMAYPKTIDPWPEGQEIRMIRLRGNTVDDAQLDRLSAAPWLYSVDLYETSVTATGLLRLLPRKLTSLVLNGSELLDDAALLSVRKMETLDNLYMHNLHITDQGLSNLAEMPRLTSIGIYGTGITSTGLKHLANLPKLENLGADGKLFDDTGISHLRQLPRLKRIHIDADQSALQRIATLETLQNIELRSKCELSATDIEVLVNCTFLQHLTLNFPVTENWVASLTKLQQIKNLVINDCLISSAGRKRLREGLPNCMVSLYPNEPAKDE